MGGNLRSRFRFNSNFRPIFIALTVQNTVIQAKVNEIALCEHAFRVDQNGLYGEQVSGHDRSCCFFHNQDEEYTGTFQLFRQACRPNLAHLLIL